LLDIGIVGEQVAIILAAGAGRRLGGVAKAMLVIGHDTFLQRIWKSAVEVGARCGLVVTAPPFGNIVAAHAASLGLQVVSHDHPERGMGYSVAAGFSAALQLPSSVDLAWLWPVDHPRVEPDTLRTMLGVFDAGRHDGVVASYRSPEQSDEVMAGGGHPLLLHRRSWLAMTAAGTASAGARTILRTLHIHRVVVDDSGVLHDVDHQQDLPA
jgi:CTP:molybdopterin cytidylyltransferase MocA